MAISPKHHVLEQSKVRYATCAQENLETREYSGLSEGVDPRRQTLQGSALGPRVVMRGRSRSPRKDAEMGRFACMCISDLLGLFN